MNCTKEDGERPTLLDTARELYAKICTELEEELAAAAEAAAQV